MKVCDERVDSLFFGSPRDQTRENGHWPVTRNESPAWWTAEPASIQMPQNSGLSSHSGMGWFVICTPSGEGLKEDIFFNKFFGFFCLHWVSIAACKLFQASEGGLLCVVVQRLPLWWLLSLRAQAPGHTGPVAVASRLESAGIHS